MLTPSTLVRIAPAGVIRPQDRTVGEVLPVDATAYSPIARSARTHDPGYQKAKRGVLRERATGPSPVVIPRIS